MSKKFEQISIKQGFMKYNGGILFRNISETEYEFKSTINENHLNALIDSGAGTAAQRSAGDAPCVTISLDLKFIATTKVGDEIIGFTKILKKTKSMVFLICHLQCKDKIIASASGIWKILNKKIS
jgi:acyl-coenzyme A thioesterase PaaI-like protein